MRTTARLIPLAALTTIGALGATLLGSPTALAAPSVQVAIDPASCQTVVTDSLRKPTETLTIAFGTGASYTGTGIAAGAKSWQRTLPRQTPPLGQRLVFWTAKQGGKVVAASSTVVPNNCLATGLLPGPVVRPAVSGAVGDSAGSKHADAWTLDSDGLLQHHTWTPGNPSTERLVGKMVGSGQTDIASMTAISDRNFDRRADMLVKRRSDASLWVYLSEGEGHLRPGFPVGRNWQAMDQIGYLGGTGTGAAEHVLARRSDGTLWRYRLAAGGLTEASQVGKGWGSMTVIASLGNQWGDRAADLVAVRGDGLLFGYQAKGGVFSSVGQIGKGWKNIEIAAVPGDLTGDGRPDLLAITTRHQMVAYQASGTAVASLGVVGFATSWASEDSSVAPSRKIVALA